MKVMILDGYNLIYRAKYSGGFRNKRDPEDLDDRSIVFSFIKSLRYLYNLHDPDKTYFVLEGRPKRRLDLDADYKGTRVRERDPGFSTQRRIIKQLIKESWPGITTAWHEDHECDDVIHVLAHDVHRDDEVVIVSSDTDFIQSIDERVRLWNPIRKKDVEPPVEPRLYVKWKALKGDQSDNIAGFQGVGTKRAASMVENPDKLEEFLGVEEGRRELYEHNKSMIAFEAVDVSSVNIVPTLWSYDKAEELKKFCQQCSFASIVKDDKKWNKFIEPIKPKEVRDAEGN